MLSQRTRIRGVVILLSDTSIHSHSQSCFQIHSRRGDSKGKKEKESASTSSKGGIFRQQKGDKKVAASESFPPFEQELPFPCRRIHQLKLKLKMRVSFSPNWGSTRTKKNYVLTKHYPETNRISGQISAQIYDNLVMHIRTNFDKNRHVLTHGSFM